MPQAVTVQDHELRHNAVEGPRQAQAPELQGRHHVALAGDCRVWCCKDHAVDEAAAAGAHVGFITAGDATPAAVGGQAYAAQADGAVAACADAGDGNGACAAAAPA